MADAPETDQERTEEPTPRRREQAAAEGRVPRSVELTAAVMLTGGTLAFLSLGAGPLGRFLTRTFTVSTNALSLAPMDSGDAVAMLRGTTFGLLAALAPFALALMALAVAVQLAQTRGTLAWKKVMPDLSHVNPVGNLKRMLGTEALVQVSRSLLKLAAIGGVAVMTLLHLAPRLMSLGSLGPAELLDPTRRLVMKLMMDAGMVFVGIGVIDFGWQWIRTRRSLRMTRQEVVQEHKEMEGDPRVKARMRSIAAARVRNRMFQAVPTADVVVVNPVHIAVALKYDPAVAPAPLVVAMGQRKIAERIKALAGSAGIPIVENKPVARALFATTRLGQMVPPALYAAVAEILAYVFRRRSGDPAAMLAARGRAS